MEFSVGKIVRNINSAGLDPAYFLLGDDSYLQKFFNNYVRNKFDAWLKIKYLNLTDNADQDLLFNELNSMTLFSSKNIYVIRDFVRLNTENKKYLLKYLLKPNGILSWYNNVVGEANEWALGFEYEKFEFE